VRRARSAFAALITLTFAPVAYAESPRWLSLSGPCPASAEEVARRVDDALVGSRPQSASASIDIGDSEAGLEVLIRLRRSETELGVKTLIVPSCDEALDAAVLIVAVAVGETSSASLGTSRSRSPRAAPTNESPASPARPGVHQEPSRDLPAAETREKNRASAWLLGGADVGTLPQPMPYVGAAVALQWLPVELRAAFRYGLPREEATEDSGASERTSSGFAALELTGCRGTGSQIRWALCAGAEFGVVRTEQIRSEGGDRVDIDERAPRLAGVLASRVGSELGGVRVELELAGFAAAVRPGGAPRTGGRAGVAAGLQF
jgi:hypothetical protein